MAVTGRGRCAEKRVPNTSPTNYPFPSACLLGSGFAAGEEYTQEDQRAARELAGRQRLAEKEDSQPYADERLEVAKDRPLPGIEAGQAVAAEDEG